MSLAGWNAKLVVCIIKVLVHMCDIVTFPFFALIHKPWKKWKQDRIIWSKLEDERDPYSCYVRQMQPDCSPKENNNELSTMDEVFKNAVAKYGEKDCYGVRDVLGEEEETAKSGKVFKKLILGDYKWTSYDEANRRMDDISRGLLAFGVQSTKPINILAETRMEWILTAQACFRINVPIVTLYATLGEDGLVHCINETDVDVIVTSADLMPKLKNFLHRLHRIKTVIYMEGRSEVSTNDIPSDLKVLPFSELERVGRESSEMSFTPPKPEDLAIIMYTSGSTGIPKGVQFTHKNIVTCIKGIDEVLKTTLKEGDLHIAYLPSAHIFELCAECYFGMLGVRVGFSSPQTLTDFSTAVKKGEKGDISVLKPTLLIAVPLMMDRVRNNILHLAGKEGSFERLMFDFAVSYKTSWLEKGFQTPLLDKYLLKTYRDFMGGQVQFVVSAGAPLSAATQKFIRSCLSVKFIQSYGLTETSAANVIADFNDNSVGTVGAPLFTCKLRLVDWKDGNYYVTDKPNPRGEIVVGGDVVTLGYFKNPEQTMEAFKIEGGERWFYSGDIGEVLPNGLFKIIDRKKDLIKLQFGEYIALGKVEAELKTSPLVDNICVVGDSMRTFLVALLIPNSFHLKSLAKEIGKENLSYDELCSDAEVTAEVTKRMREHGKKHRLFGSELPHKIKLCNDDWTPESGLVTAAFKLRRKFVENHYASVIENMYAEND